MIKKLKACTADQVYLPDEEDGALRSGAIYDE